MEENENKELQENNNKELQEDNTCETGQQAVAEQNKPVYSQMSIDYVAAQVKKAHKKGVIKGVIITSAVVVCIFGLFAVISIVRMIANGSAYSKVMSIMGGSVINSEALKKADTIYNLIDKTYIEEVDKDTVRDGLYKGMLEALDDPYSVYYDEEEYAEMMEGTSGQFEGIGAYLSQDPDTMLVTVARPIKNSPAEEVGILAGDIIVEVGGEDVTGQDINLVVSKVRGPAGSKVDIGVSREGESDILHFEVERAKIDVESVESEMFDGNIGYIYISEFADATGDQFEEAYDKLMDDGMTSLIVDLRTNGGGYVDTAVEVADKLVKEGNIVTIRNRDGISYSYDDAGDDNYLTLPCVFLVDGNTASASEILTGAIKDYGLATVIGTQTFGKGIVQDVIPLGDGTGVKITNSKYYTPNGENIHKVGITPDIIVEWDYKSYRDNGTDNQLEAAKEYLLTGHCDEWHIEDEEE